MNKKIRQITLIMGMVIIVSGCGKNSETITTYEKQGVTENKIQETKKNSDKNKSQEELKILSGTSYDTEEGRYYIDDTEDSTIRYIDYKTKKEVYLCNKLNCKHNNKDCSAVLPGSESSMESFLFGDGTYIYILTTPYDSSGSTEVIEQNEGVEEGIISMGGGNSNEPPAIYRMKKDGTDREKVFEFKSGIITEQHVIGDGKYFYIITKKHKSETKGSTTYHTGYGRKLVKLDLEKGTSEDVMDLENEQNIIGCSGRNLIVSKDDFGRELSIEEQQNDDKYKNLYDKSKCIISSINVDDKKIVQQKSIQNSNKKIHNEMIYDDKMYISYEGQKFIEIMDLKTGETKKLKLDDSYSIEKIISIRGEAPVMVGSLYSAWGNSDTKGWSNYLINLETGKVTKSTLQTQYKTPIGIEGESEEYLYVCSNYKNDTEYVSWVGVYQDYMSEVEYSIISKRDYLKNKANYKKIKLLNGGKLNHDED